MHHFFWYIPIIGGYCIADTLNWLLSFDVLPKWGLHSLLFLHNFVTHNPASPIYLLRKRGYQEAQKEYQDQVLIIPTIMATAQDPTFRTYSAEEARLYAASRLSYSQKTYDKVLDYHITTGGKFDLLLDVGCGPGNATRDLARSFDRTIGADPGEQMIDSANALGGKTKSGKDIEFVIADAEAISQIKGLEPESVDLLTSAMAVSCNPGDKSIF